MRNISIVGGGQFGLHLGIYLRTEGYEVTIHTNKTGDEIAGGRVLSSQIVFESVRSLQSDLGMNLWGEEGTCTGNYIAVGDGQGEKLLGFYQPTNGILGQSIDQRISFPVWMRMFTELGGSIKIADVDIDYVEKIAAESDLVVVSAGKGDLGKLFSRDAELSRFDEPQRHVTMFYVDGMKPDEYGDRTARVNQIDGVGEYVTFPGETLSGQCDMLLFESQIGGPMHEIIGDAADGESVLRAGQEILKKYVPWEFKRANDLQLTDDQAWLAGALSPTIRKPFASLPSGKSIMGGGDVTILNDPIVGQGANNASKHAAIVGRAIIDHGNRIFDEAFMQSTFDRHWADAQWACAFSNLMLSPPKHLGTVMASMPESAAMRTLLQNGFGNPTVLADWLYDEESAITRIQTVTSADSV